jgi:LPS export ABC transporter protein LptC
MSPPRKPAPRRALLLLLALALACGAAYYVFRPWGAAREAAPPAKVDTSGMTVQNIHQSSTRDGRTEWTLEAATAIYLLAEKKVLLKDMHVTFFRKDGGEVYLTARDGTVMSDTQDMEARGDVVVWNEQYRLTTEELKYRHETRIITSDTHSRITNPSGEIVGDNLQVDLNTNQMAMNGHVHGRIIPD